MVDQTHMERQPQSTMSAQYSLPYCCAAAIALDPMDPVSFSESRLGDAEVLRIAKLVEPSIDPALDSVFPRHFGGGVRIRLRDGTVLSSTVLDSHNPTRRDEIQRKFRKLTSNFLSRRRQESIIEATANLDRLESMSELTKLLRNLELPVL
jgi:2-methylcitrate dehydratase PrpD